MSETYSAFMELEMSNESLSRWLAAPVPAVSRRSDWRSIAGQWRLTNGEYLDSSSAEAIAEFISDCEAMLARHLDNRAALRAILETAEADSIKVAAYNRAGTRFVAGSLTYSENLYDFVVFLAVVRGAADFFEAEDRGLALIHDYIWGEDGNRQAVAGIHLVGRGDTNFVSSTELGNATEVFEGIVEAMLDGRDDPEFKPLNQLDQI